MQPQMCIGEKLSKWRPAPKSNVYVIGDVHGRYDQLVRIFNRIFPLRKTDGFYDRLIMLGDYVDRHIDSHKVMDLLIKVKKKYGDQITLLRGNHEVMFLQGIIPVNDSAVYRMWMNNGGDATLIGYLKRAGLEMESPFIFPRSSVPRIIPKEHLNFICDDLVDCYLLDDWIFAHAGYDVNKTPEEQDNEDLHWGNYIFSHARMYKKNKRIPPWDKTIVIGHYWKGPFVSEKFIMLDVSSDANIMVAELNSMEAFLSKPNKSRMVKVNLNKVL